MNKEELQKTLEAHKSWLCGRPGGKKANLRGADLRGADLRGADLRGADLRGADLRGADLSSADLSSANLSSANLSSANLSSANLSYADLSNANLSGADLSGADLSYADLSNANLSSANLSSANLSCAYLSCANLSSANLSSANLRFANLSCANLSSCRGIQTGAEWLREHTQTTNRGCILAYKAFGNTDYPSPDHWKLEAGEYITETVNPDRGTECGCGVNVGTFSFVDRTYGVRAHSVWLVGIDPEDIADVVVPFRTDGAFRAARVRLIKRLNKVDGEWVKDSI